MNKKINESFEIDEAVPGAGLLTTLKSKLPGSMGTQAKGQIEASNIAKQLYNEYYAYIGKIGQQPNSKNIIDFLKQKNLPTNKASEEIKKQVAAPATKPDIISPTTIPKPAAPQPATAAQPATVPQPAVTAESTMRNLINIIENNFSEQTGEQPIAGGSGLVGTITQRTSNRVGKILLAAVQEYIETQANKPAAATTAPAAGTQPAAAAQPAAGTQPAAAQPAAAQPAAAAKQAKAPAMAKLDVNSIVSGFNQLSRQDKQKFMSMIQKKAR